jgi:hypothetical protein
MKALIISNCQVAPLSHALALHCRDLRIDTLPVHLLDDTNNHIVQEAFKVDYDFVITVPLSESFGEITTSRIGNHFANICTIPSIYFAGLHPDLTYLGNMGQRVNGPLVDYHSKLVIAAHVLGIPEKDVSNLFSDSVFGAIGHYEIYERSLREITEREKAIDVPVSDIIVAAFRNGLAMYSINHPSHLVIGPFVARLAEHLNIRYGVELTGWPVGQGIQDSLSSDVIFPIYPPVAERFGCPAGSYQFKPPTRGGVAVNAIPLKTFISLEYRALSEAGVDHSWSVAAQYAREFAPVLTA